MSDLSPDMRAALGFPDSDMPGESPIPEDDIPPIDPPKRRPGRPKGSKNRNTADTPPRAAGVGRPATAAAKRIEDGLTATLKELGIGLSMASPVDGAIIYANAEKVAKRWANVAAVNPKVRKTLEGMLTGGGMIAAIGATLSMVAPIAIMHGLVPVPEQVKAAVFFMATSAVNEMAADLNVNPEDIIGAGSQ